MAEVYPGIERKLSRLPGVYAAVVALATEIDVKAKANLLRHRDENVARIVMERRRPDVMVHLVDVAAVSIEYGRGGYWRNGRWIGAAQGIWVLHDAAFGNHGPGRA